MLLDQRGIAIRTGHHCSSHDVPLKNSVAHGLHSSIYNTLDEVDLLFDGLRKGQGIV